MSEQDFKEDQNSLSPNEPSESEENELTFSDKLVGVFTEPSATFDKVSKFPPKTIDWFLPYAILLLIIAVCNVLMMKNPDINYQVKQKQTEALNNRINDELKSGKITAEQAEQTRSMAEKQFGMMDSPIIMAVTVISTILFGFIAFFIAAGYFYLFAKYVFKDSGTFNGALVANGLTAYFSIINVIIATILALTFGRMMRETSLASLLNIETGTLLNYILSKFDIFAIWTYIIFSIGLAKMFNSKDTKKYFALVFGSWIGWSLLFFALTKFVPFFKSYGV
jgi:hypothetical protein